MGGFSRVNKSSQHIYLKKEVKIDESLSQSLQGQDEEMIGLKEI
jgi:hypothetical protein